MYRSNPQFVPVQRVLDLDSQRILYRYEAPNSRQFAVDQDRREQCFNCVDQRYAVNNVSTQPAYRDPSATRCNTAECSECTCGNINSYQANTCQSGCCDDSCQRPAYEQQTQSRVFYRFS